MPHCDTLDGPVVKAARKALESKNINYILIWVPQAAEKELKKAFEKTLEVRALGKKAKDLADYWFSETAVRLHRAGEGEGFTGLKPARLSEGPVVPKADQDIEKGTKTSQAVEYALHTIKDELMRRYQKVISKKKYDLNNVKAGRDYIASYINFVVYTHSLYAQVVKSRGKDVHESAVGHRH